MKISILPVKVLKFVYFPGTQTGFRYDYSQYFGMVYKMWQMRAMQVSTDSLTETGTILNEGTWAASTHYNYVAVPADWNGMQLTDVPKYSRRYDDWQGRTDILMRWQNRFDNTAQVKSLRFDRSIKFAFPI